MVGFQIPTVLHFSICVGFGQLTGSDLLPAQSEKSIRQVLHQLGHLRRLWQDVLPPNVYCKSVGTILNTVIDDLIQKVIPLEDIAADAATQLWYI